MADFYGSVEGFNTWLEENGYTLESDDPEAPPPPAPEMLLRRATRYIDATYGAQFIGQPSAGVTQRTSWPRNRVPGVAPDVVPWQVEIATYVAARQEALEPGSLAAFGSSSGRVVREKVDGAVEVAYANPGTDLLADMRILSTEIDGLLSPYLDTPAGTAIFVV